MNSKQAYKRTGFFAIILVALGIVINTILNESLGSLGTVFIAVGALLLISAFAKKKKADKDSQKE